MSKQIIINSGIREKRAALIVDNSLNDILFERDTYDQIASNIYKGRVKDVLAGMQAAFVDIGIEKNAFLHISDIAPLLNKKQRQQWEKNQLGIQHVLQPGQKIMVQVVKEPIGSKGPKITCKVTIPGRYLVLLPFESRVGISRRISQSHERNRLKKIAEDITKQGQGVIVRTNAYQQEKEILKKDYEYLFHLWKKIRSDYGKSKAPALIYKDVELIKMIVRDYLSSDIDKLVIDSREDYQQLADITSRIAPEVNSRIYFYDKDIPIFKYYKIEKEFNSIFKRKIWLKSGGYIIIDSTEALISIDVNTGKYIGKNNLQETVFKTNLEAAREIARQLKLRDIGGIIIIDFIDMESRKHQEEVLKVLREELNRDRTRTAVLGLTQLGLVEMTRKKVREGLGELIQKECPYCEGTGLVMSETTMALKVIRELNRLVAEEDFSAILIELYPEVAAVLIGTGGEKLKELEEELDIDIYIMGNNKLHIEDMNIVEKGSKEKLKALALPVKAGERYRVVIEERHFNNTRDGIARLKGYIIIVEGAGHMVDEKIDVIIKDVYRTFARAEMV